MIGHMLVPNSAIGAVVLKLQEPDKQKHFWVCFVLMPAIFFWTSMANAVLMTMLIGYAKELWDRRYGSGFCWYDMMANALGTGASLLFMCALYVMGIVAW
jgi:hypothetical protein